MFDVTLTFDNGPEPLVTPQVLDALGDAEIKSTFFMLGEKLQTANGQALAHQVAREGHWIGNHTFTHTVALGVSPDPRAPQIEIGDTQALIADLAHPLRWFRPTGIDGAIGPHLLSPAALQWLKDGRYSCVLWNCVPRDWLDPEGWVETAVQECRARPWSVVVVHDLPTGAMDHLPRFIERIRAEGGRFRQDFPEDCVPLRAGREVVSLAPYVTH